MSQLPPDWTRVSVPDIRTLPRPVFVRAAELASKSYFAKHAHAWDQLVYARAGVLVVDLTDRRFVIPPEQAVWLPAGQDHSTSTASGAQFRSLYIDPAYSRQKQLNQHCRVLGASPLVREMISKAARFPADYDEHGYPGRFMDLLMDELSALASIGEPLPWPTSEKLKTLCTQLYADPADQRRLTEWGASLGVSSRTLARHLESETGLTFRNWRHRLRVFKAVEYLSQGHSVTTTALMLGYATPSAFIDVFKTHYGQTPLQFVRAMSE